jgi:hypothetical protein
MSEAAFRPGCRMDGDWESAKDHSRQLGVSERLPLSPLKADIHAKLRHVSKVPLPDIADGYIGSSSTPENSKWPE